MSASHSRLNVCWRKLAALVWSSAVARCQTLGCIMNWLAVFWRNGEVLVGRLHRRRLHAKCEGIARRPVLVLKPRRLLIALCDIALSVVSWLSAWPMFLRR